MEHMEDDMILPDDFVDSTPEDIETTVDEQEPEFEETVEPTEEVTTPTDEPAEPQEPVTQPQKVKIKFNHEEREIDLEEAAQLAQKGMVFDKAIERAAQEARDKLIADMGYTWNGKPITTEAEYKQAMAEQELINKYKDRDLPDEVIKELIESRRDREERQREKAAKEEEARIQSTWNDFFKFFEEVNERAFDPKKDTLPAEVEQAIQNGHTPLEAYMRHHTKELRNQLKIAKQNQENMRKAPVGSVTAGGGTKTEPEDAFLAGFNSI